VLYIFVDTLVGDHLVLKDFGPYGIGLILMMCVVSVIVTVMLLSAFGPYGIICMTTYVYCGIVFMTVCSVLLILPSFLTCNLLVISH
jgi:hypothetical protein